MEKKRNIQQNEIHVKIELKNWKNLKNGYHIKIINLINSIF